MIRFLKRWRIRTAAVVVLLGVLGSAAPAAMARTLKATDTAQLHKVSVSGSSLIEEGKATGTLPGKMRASVDVSADISGTFKITVPGVGTITGRGTATLTPPTGNRPTPYESFHGTVTVKGGTGRFAHAHGQTGLYGTFDRDTYALVIQTTGTLAY